MHDPKTLKPFLAAMGALTGFAMFLLIARMIWTSNIWYAFLSWNLLLAWLPFLFAQLASKFEQENPRKDWGVWASLGAWLLFFPNAPYIFTDFVHFKNAITSVPWWYDLGMLLTFSATGLMLGLASLKITHRIVADRLGARLGWLFVWSSTLLCGFGIYIGRFMRLNSWDAFSDPFQLLILIGHRVFDPFGHPRTWVVTIMFGVLMGMLYFALHALTARDRATDPIAPVQPS